MFITQNVKNIMLEYKVSKATAYRYLKYGFPCKYKTYTAVKNLQKEFDAKQELTLTNTAINNVNYDSQNSQIKQFSQKFVKNEKNENLENETIETIEKIKNEFENINNRIKVLENLINSLVVNKNNSQFFSKVYKNENSQKYINNIINSNIDSNINNNEQLRKNEKNENLENENFNNFMGVTNAKAKEVNYLHSKAGRPQHYVDDKDFMNFATKFPSNKQIHMTKAYNIWLQLDKDTKDKVLNTVGNYLEANKESKFILFPVNFLKERVYDNKTYQPLLKSLDVKITAPELDADTIYKMNTAKLQQVEIDRLKREHAFDWPAILKNLELELSSNAMEAFIKPCNFYNISNKKLILIAPSQFIKQWVLNNLKNDIIKVMGNIDDVDCIVLNMYDPNLLSSYPFNIVPTNINAGVFYV